MTGLNESESILGIDCGIFPSVRRASAGRSGGLNFVFELECDAKQSGEVNTGSERPPNAAH